MEIHERRRPTGILQVRILSVVVTDFFSILQINNAVAIIKIIS